jgi:DNA (cytosine-5)-methyltransferase 1
MRERKVMVRLDDEEFNLLSEVSSDQSLTVSTWARAQLLRAARGRTIPETHRSSTLPVLSLFCGAGGLDEGFRQAGFSTGLATDINQDAVNTFAWNHVGAKAFRRDIRDLTLEDLDRESGGMFKPVGVIGGPPCQSFSVSNVYQREDDPRHGLPEAYAALLGALNRRSPMSFFVFENVVGLLGKRHRERFEKFKSLLSGAGFDIDDKPLNACDYGVAQDRPRVFIVGINRHLHPNATFEWPLPEPSNKTVREVIFGLPEPEHNAPGLEPHSFPAHPNHWCMVPRSKKFTIAGQLIEGQALGRSFRTLAWDRPSWTVAYGHREVHVHPNGHRRLSVYEAMLLQSFPQDYQLLGNISAQIRLVSDAVPPRLGWHVACAIRRSLGL